MGCVSLKQKVQPQEDQVVENMDQNEHNQLIPLGFIKGIEEHSYNIVNSSKTSMDQNSNLMNSFQFFKFNSRHLWQMAINPKYSKSNINLILESTEGLLSVLPTYIKSNMTYTLFICQILAVYAKIIFQFHATNGRRFLELDTQSRYLNLIKKIEQELTIERANDLLLNNVEFELFQIQAAFTLAPTNSTEGQEILTQFLGGALKAAMTFTLNDDLLEGLKKGIIYIYNEYKKHQIKRKFELIYYITGLKYEIIQNIEKNSEIKTIIQILTRFYVNIIKDCVDWEIKCCWIKSISDIINHKIQLKPQDLQEKLFQDSLKNKQILKISSEYYVNITNISNNENANMIFQQIKQLWLLSNLQLELVSGSQEIKGFEDIYKIKLKLQSTESNALIEKSTLNSIIDRIKQQTILHQKIKEQIKCQDNNNYLNALINEQLEEILLLDQDLHQLIENKAVLSTVVAEQDDSTDYQISMINYLIDILRTNNQILQDENFKNQLSKVGISYEQKDNQMNNKNIILRLELQLKSITSGTIKTQQTKIKIFNIFSVIDQYEKVIIHNIEFLLKLQIQFDLVETIEYCDYRGLVAIINQLYLILQQIQSDKTLKIEVFQLPSKIQTQLKKQLLYFRHTNLQLAILSQFTVKDNVAQKILKIQQQSCEIINRLIIGVQRVQQILQSPQKKKDNDDFLMLKKILQLLDEKTILSYNQNKVEQIKQMAIDFKQYIQSMIEDQKQNSKNDQMQDLLGIDNTLKIISDFIIIPSFNEQFYLELLRNLKTLLQTHFGKEINQLNKVEFQYEKENLFYKEIIENAKQLSVTQQENLIIITNIQKLSDSVNQHHQNIQNLQKYGNQYQTYIVKTKKQIDLYVEQEKTEDYSLKSEIVYLQHLEQLLNSHNFQQYPKELESQIIFILKSIQNQNVPTKHKLFDQFAVQMEDALNNSQWRIRQCIIFELQQMQSNLLEPQVVAVNQALLLKLQIYETDNRIKVLFQSPELIKQQTQLMEQYWPTIEEQVQKTIKEKLDSLNSIVYQIQSEKQEQAKQRLQKKYKELQEEINEELQNVSTVTSSLGITVLFLQDMKQDLNRIQDTLNQIQQAINEIGQNIKALRGKSFWDLLELRMKNVFIQMHIALAETIYIPIKTREKQIGVNSEDNQTNLFTDDLFGDGEVNEFIWKETKDSMMIHGLAGSGKSTSSRKIEEFIWRIYEKSQNETDIVPIVPIFVQLPTLKEPSVYAVEETLKSDNYRFNNKQIDEMKEGVNQGKLRLILIFDSYDELQQQFIGINLYHSNKLEKWRKQGDTCYPKVITTSRSELFTSENYHSWFISDKIEKYKEIRLVKFNDSQIQAYIDEFVFLQKKLTVKEFSEIKNSIEFEKQWRRDISTDQDLQLRLENFVQKVKLFQTKQALDLLWSAKVFRENMKEANLFILLETPFMMEIVMQVLPKVAEQYTEGNQKQVSQSKQMFTTFSFYQVFLDQYFDRQIYKLQSKENFIEYKTQLWDFAQRLAIEMTKENLSQVEFKQNGLVFKKATQDWKDQFFNDDDAETGKYKRLFRQCIPLRQKLGKYSFNHKSLQEFLVAKWFIENIDRIEEQKYYSEVNWSDISVEWFEGIIKFIKSNPEQQQIILKKLNSVLKSTGQNEQLIIAGSNSIYIMQKLNYHFFNEKYSNIKIKDVNLKDIKLDSCKLNNSNFNKVSLEGSNLNYCKLDNSNFENVNLSNVNLEQASLKNCKWLNLKFDETNNFQYLDCSIDRIDIIEKNLIQFFNTQKGEISTIYPMTKEKKGFKQINEKIIDYDYFYSENLMYLLGDNIKYISKNDKINESAKNQWFLGNSSTKLIRYTKVSSQQSSSLTLFYVVNGQSLLEIKIQFILSKLSKQIEQETMGCFNGEYETIELTKYEVISDEAFKTRVLIEESTELIAHGQDFILATHPGSRISLYNMKSDQILFQNKYINQGNIVSIAINDDGQYVIGGSDCSLKLYQNDEKQKLFFGHIGVVTILQFIENQYFLSASQEDHSIRLWNIENQQSLWLFVTQINITSFAVSQEQKLLFTGSAQGILQTKDFYFQNLIKCEYKYHKAGILCCATNRFKEIFASGSKDNVIKLWDLNTRKQIGSDMIHGTLLCLALGSDKLYSGEQQGLIVQWKQKDQTIQQIYNNYGDPVTHLLENNQDCYFRSTDSQIKCFAQEKLYFSHKGYIKQTFQWANQLENYSKAKEFPIFQETLDNQVTQITRIINSIGSQYYGYGMVNGILIIQHKYGQKLKEQIFEGLEIIELIELLNNFLICISQQGLKILKINNESIEILNSCIFKNNCRLAILTRSISENEEIQETLITVDDEEITLRNIKDIMNVSFMNDNVPRSIKLNSNTKIQALTVSKGNNQILYCGTQLGTVQIWDIEKEQMIEEIRLSKLPITKIIYLDQSKQLLSSSEDGNIYFIKNQQIQERQLQSGKPIKNMEISEDERFLILAHSSNLTQWDIFEDKIDLIDTFGDFIDISALSVNFAHLFALVGDVNKLHKIPLSLQRISKFYSEQFNCYPSCYVQSGHSDIPIITGDSFGRICSWKKDLELAKDFVLFEKQRINEIVRYTNYEFSSVVIISYDAKIVVLDYFKKQLLHEFPIQSEFVSCRQYYDNCTDIYYGIDLNLYCVKFDKLLKQYKLIQLTDRFSKFDKMIAFRKYLIIYSEKKKEIQIFVLKNKSFNLLEDHTNTEFMLNQSKMKDSVIQNKFGHQLNKLFQSCGAIDLTEEKEQLIQQDP